MPEDGVRHVDTVTHCPFCGFQGGFDGQGTRTDKRRRINMEGPSEEEYIETRYRVHCPSCDGTWEAVLGENIIGVRDSPEDDWQHPAEVRS